jgi:hypothetical protein
VNELSAAFNIRLALDPAGAPERDTYDNVAGLGQD